jgi:hypothetical protein
VVLPANRLLSLSRIRLPLPCFVGAAAADDSRVETGAFLIEDHGRAVEDVAGQAGIPDQRPSSTAVPPV